MELHKIQWVDPTKTIINREKERERDDCTKYVKSNADAMRCDGYFGHMFNILLTTLILDGRLAQSKVWFTRVLHRFECTYIYHVRTLSIDVVSNNKNRKIKTTKQTMNL